MMKMKLKRTVLSFIILLFLFAAAGCTTRTQYDPGASNYVTATCESGESHTGNLRRVVSNGNSYEIIAESGTVLVPVAKCVIEYHNK